MLALPVRINFPSLNLNKNFIYYTKSDIQYNIDAFLLSTGLRLECIEVECKDKFSGCPKCQFTMLINHRPGDQGTWELVDLRKVVNPVDYICPYATLSFVQLFEAERLIRERDTFLKELANRKSDLEKSEVDD